MSYDIPLLLKKHKACLDNISEHFVQFFHGIDYAQELPRKVKKHSIRHPEDLSSVLGGPGFYFIATDVRTIQNPCSLIINESLHVVYRGHSSDVRERIESHLFYDLYHAKDSGRRFTICMKLDRKNININKAPLNRNQWVVITHSMPKSTTLIREAAEVGFDSVFDKPIGCDK